MADPTTIFDYAKQRQAAAKQGLAASQQRLAKIQADITSRSADLDRAADAVIALEKKAAEVRKQLSEVATTADGEVLLAELEQIIIRIRTSRADALKAKEALTAAQSEAERAQADLSAATARLARADDEVKQADQPQKLRAKWKNELTTPPLSTINTAAANALNDKPYTDAEARIKAYIPAKLLERAEARRADEAARIEKIRLNEQAAEDAALDELKQNGGLEGKAERLRVSLLRVEAKVREFVTTAKSRFDQAITMLAQIADPKHSPLTAEQIKRITDPALEGARGTAIDEEKAVTDKLKVVEAKQDDLDKAVLDARAQNKNPDDQQSVKDAKKALATAQADFTTADTNWRAKQKDRDDKLKAVGDGQTALGQAIQKAIAAKKNPDTDPDVIKAKADLEKAQADLALAETAYRQSPHGILDTFEAAVPDSIWQLLEDFEQAKRTLEWLRDTDPAKLKTDLEKAEEDYVKARSKSGTSETVLEQLATERGLRAARNQSVTQVGASRLFSALRGDY
ncbi:MAG TPA: hypothetical protein VKA70_11655 [Blastocatellia bacterium]|nr:hypothetical protein [Blastocatellia bacterium]